MKLALLVEYDGTRYFGFQYQADVPTIQGELEKAIKKVTGEEVRIKGAGRTDAGVHAKGQVISFESQTSLPLGNFIRALNFYLPSDIAVRAGCEVPQDFDARRSAQSREYRYIILNSATPSPLLHRRALLVIQKLDVELMSQGTRMLVGKHNFASFAGSLGRRNPVRQVFRAEISRKGELIFFDVEADSFLPQQMRRMTAALIRLGLGRLGLEEFRELIDCGKVSAARWVAPSYGLYLTRVNYPDLQLDTSWENA
ncbi:MAG: tRNA pseudouridine(38-40) synthase TruA [Chloroflexi bacterium]|nr:MAG: tRNA pseudouridine(38-40) synthase TruA [Chloroflexota bacterium]